MKKYLHFSREYLMLSKLM